MSRKLVTRGCAACLYMCVCVPMSDHESCACSSAPGRWRHVRPPAIKDRPTAVALAGSWSQPPYLVSPSRAHAILYFRTNGTVILGESEQTLLPSGSLVSKHQPPGFVSKHQPRACTPPCPVFLPVFRLGVSALLWYSRSPVSVGE